MREEKLPTKLAKRISGKCLYSGCGEDALDGSDYCASHDARIKGWKRTSARRRRQDLADRGICIVEQCGKKVGKRKRANGTIQQRRCGACSKAKLAAEREARRERGVDHGDRGVDYVTEATDENDPRFRCDPGTNWSRYRGKGRRGRLTREEQIDEDIRDLRHAIAYLHDAARRIERLKLPEVMELPTIQRQAAYRTAGEPIGSATRQLEELAERYE